MTQQTGVPTMCQAGPKFDRKQLLSGLQASGNINYMAEVRLKSPGALAMGECPLTSCLSFGAHPQT